MRFLLLFLLFGASAQAQTLPTVGTDDTFDLATWNIEHFANPSQSPSNDALQAERVLAILQAAGIDLWALQELDIQSGFNDLVTDLGAPYAGVWVADETSFPIGYGYIYNTDVVELLEATTILESFEFQFAFRPPLLFRANITLPSGTVQNVRFINIHAKCCGSSSDYNRRAAAAVALKDYVDDLLLTDAPVFVLGDFNDELRSSISGNDTSPYQIFRDDDEDYRFASYVLDLANVPTFCSNDSCSDGSTIDHILLTRTVNDSYVSGSIGTYDEAVAFFPNYVNTTSDHVPVYARFDLIETVDVGEDASAPQPFALRAPFPNPFQATTTFAYTLPESADVRLDVFDALGRRVATVEEGTRRAGLHTVSFEAGTLLPGLYIARLSAAGQTATRRLVLIP